MSTPAPEQPVPDQSEQPPARKPRKWLWWVVGIVVGLAVIGALLPEDETGDAGTTPPAATTEDEPTTQEQPETTEPAETTEAAEEPAEDPEDAWDPEAARQELLDAIYSANGDRTIEDTCDTDMLIEGTWWQCYFEDLEWATQTRVQVNLATPGDVDVDQVSADARRWFVNMLADHPGLEQVTTFVNGLDTGTDSTPGQ